MRVLLASGFLSALVLIALAQPASAIDGTWGTGGGSYTTSTGIGWHYSAEEQAFFRTPTTFAVDAGGPELEWSLVPTCDGNAPEGSAHLCQAALCTTPDGDPGVEFWVFTRALGEPDSAWSSTGTQCVPGEERVDLADIEAEVRRIVEDRFREVARPTVTIAPATGGLVNLPVLAWTDDAGDVTLDFDQPLPGSVQASPTYEWVWSNGSRSTGPGMPYTDELSPTRTPDHYVHAVYNERGEASVQLTVTWTGTVTVPGLAAVAISPLVYDTPASFDVREARAQLIAGDG